MTALDINARLADLMDANEIAYAVELTRTIGGDLRTLLAARDWRDQPQALLGAVVQGDELHRELVRHALWCARRVAHLWREQDREVLTDALATLDRWLVGEATRDEVDRARVAAREAAYSAYAADADDAAYVAYAAADADDAAYVAYAAACAANAADAASYSADAAAYAAAYAADAATAAAEHRAQNAYLIDRAVALAGGAQ